MFCYKGSVEKYQIGCLTPIDPTLLAPVKLNVNEEYLSLIEVEQCKITCSTNQNQIFLVDSNSKCYCALNRNELAKSFSDAKCSDDTSILKAYIATNLNFDRSKDASFDLDVKQIVKNDLIEIDDIVGFKIRNKNSVQNFKTHIDFGENVFKTSVGDSFLFHQYSKHGMYMIKVTVSSTSNDNYILSREFNVSVQTKQDKNPMFSVKLGVISQISSENKWHVNFNAVIGGGAPFNCLINFGDETNVKHEFVEQLNSFNLKHTYDFTGLYNVTIKCNSKSINDSFVNDWKIVYLPKERSETSPLTIGNVPYFDHHIILKLNDQESETKLELPIQLASPGLLFHVDDLSNNQMAIVQWNSPERSLQTIGSSKGNIIIK